jgi:hypothetical protein
MIEKENVQINYPNIHCLFSVYLKHFFKFKVKITHDGKNDLNDELGGTWKEVVVAVYKLRVLYQQLPGNTENTAESSVGNYCFPTEI